jgi:hypothetical protein
MGSHTDARRQSILIQVNRWREKQSYRLPVSTVITVKNKPGVVSISTPVLDSNTTVCRPIYTKVCCPFLRIQAAFLIFGRNVVQVVGELPGRREGTCRNDLYPFIGESLRDNVIDSGRLLDDYSV